MIIVGSLGDLNGLLGNDRVVSGLTPGGVGMYPAPWRSLFLQAVLGLYVADGYSVPMFTR